MKSLIQKLVETTGPSGYEAKVRELVTEQIVGFVDELRVDPLGSLIARKGQKTGDGMRLMLSAHMDEIGVIVTHVDENGFARFTAIGGVYPRNCIGGRVRFMNGTQGLIGGEKPDGPDKVHTLEQLFIDVGATSPKNCPVKIGDIAAFERPFLDLGSRLVAKSMDDRIGVAILVETIRQLKQTPNEVFFVFSTQEEVGLRGATAAAFGVDPEVGLAVDVTATGDTPKGIKMDVSLGKGPTVKIRDSRILSDPRVVNWMVQTAEKARIPYQLEVLEQGGTDAGAIQLTRMGVPAGCISIPCRYVHSPSEMVDYDDVQNAVRLLIELISNPIRLL